MLKLSLLARRRHILHSSWTLHNCWHGDSWCGIGGKFSILKLSTSAWPHLGEHLAPDELAASVISECCFHWVSEDQLTCVLPLCGTLPPKQFCFFPSKNVLFVIFHWASEKIQLKRTNTLKGCDLSFLKSVLVHQRSGGILINLATLHSG